MINLGEFAQIYLFIYVNLNPLWGLNFGESGLNLRKLITAQEFRKKVANMYFAAKDGKIVAMIHLFGIKFSKQILVDKISANEIIKYTKSSDGSIMSKSYATKINKICLKKRMFKSGRPIRINRYAYDQIKEILKIRIELAKGLISCEITQRQTLKIVPTYPLAISQATPHG